MKILRTTVSVIALVALAIMLFFLIRALGDEDEPVEQVSVTSEEQYLIRFPATILTDTTFAVLGNVVVPEATRGSINTDQDVRFTMHMGNARAEGAPCNQATLDSAAEFLDGFTRPLVYTPGPADWSNCHLSTTSTCDPVECLDLLRSELYEPADRTLGEFPARVASQPASEGEYAAVPENQRWVSHQVVFATVHTLDGGNGRAPWFGLEGGDPTDLRRAEYEARELAALDWLDAAFDEATARGASGVVLGMNANTVDGFAIFATEFNDQLQRRAAEFDRPVLLIHSGDDGIVFDTPWPTTPNVQRLASFGGDRDNWIRVTVRPNRDDVFFLQQMGQLDPVEQTPPFVLDFPTGPAN